MDVQRCIVCESTEILDARTPPICTECTRKLGITAMPPPRRNARPCTVCNHRRFIRVIPREYTAYAMKNGYICHGAPMTLTRETGATDRWILDGKSVPAQVTLDDGRGTLETYVCTKCGFVEWYCLDPEAIPIGPQFMSEVVDLDAEAEPYR